MSANTWNVELGDMPHLIYAEDEQEWTGARVYGLVLTDPIPCTFDGEKKTLCRRKFGTLEKIVRWLESDPQPNQKPFCEKISGGVTDSGEQLYTAPGVPLTEDVYIWWNHEDLEQTSGTRTVLMDCGYADEDDLSNPHSEAWESMERLVVHSEPLLVTVENVLAYAKGGVFTVNSPERIEILAAGEILDELMEHFNQGDAPGFIRGLGR